MKNYCVITGVNKKTKEERKFYFPSCMEEEISDDWEVKQDIRTIPAQHIEFSECASDKARIMWAVCGDCLTTCEVSGRILSETVYAMYLLLEEFDWKSQAMAIFYGNNLWMESFEDNVIDIKKGIIQKEVVDTYPWKEDIGRAIYESLFPHDDSEKEDNFYIDFLSQIDGYDMYENLPLEGHDTVVFFNIPTTSLETV